MLAFLAAAGFDGFDKVIGDDFGGEAPLAGIIADFVIQAGVGQHRRVLADAKLELFLHVVPDAKFLAGLTTIIQVSIVFLGHDVLKPFSEANVSKSICRIFDSSHRLRSGLSAMCFVSRLTA